MNDQPRRNSAKFPAHSKSTTPSWRESLTNLISSPIIIVTPIVSGSKQLSFLEENTCAPAHSHDDSGVNILIHLTFHPPASS